jgi:2-polyprenyl-3-methyl-5-hydroxy-6-metoxy-1,4-benzoquinol methylase
MTTEKLKLESVSCGVCGADNCLKYASGKDYEYYTSEDEFQMVECQDCGNIYLNPRPVKEELSIIYPANYYAYNYDQAINPVAIRAKDWLDSIKVKNWLKYLKSSEPRFLDVGCGNGRYLKMLHRLGVPKEQLYGVEMSEEQIAHLNSEGFQGYYGRIEDVEAELPSESFDLIVLLQVLEHVEQPRSAIKSLAGLLKKDGLLIIETPNINSLDVKLFNQSYWGGYHFPRHWNLFNIETLTRIVNEQDMNVKAINFLPAQTFWILSFNHLISNRLHMPCMGKIFNPFQNLALLSLFTSFDMVRAKLGFETSNIQIVATKI